MEDVGVPRARVPDMLRAIERIAAKHDVRIGTFGHAGDGNLHPDLVFERGDPNARGEDRGGQEGPLPRRARPRRHRHRRARHRDGAARLARGPAGRRCGARHARDQGGPRSARDPQPGTRDLAQSVGHPRAARGPYQGHERLDAPVDHAPRVRPAAPAARAAAAAIAVAERHDHPVVLERRRRAASDRASTAPAAATSPTVAEIARLQALVDRRPDRRRRPARPRVRAPPAGPRDGRSVALRAGRRGLRDRPRSSPPTTPWSWPGSAASSSASTSSPRRSRPAARRSRCRRTSPRRRAVVVDALVELGRYDEADAAAARDARGPGRPLDARPRLVRRASCTASSTSR